MEQPSHSRRAERQNTGNHTSNSPAGSAPRSACDQCHRRKERCTGHIPCDRCTSSSSTCTYSLGRPLGKPKGRRNTTTSGIQSSPPSSASWPTIQNRVSKEIPRKEQRPNLNVGEDTNTYNAMVGAALENQPQSLTPAAKTSSSTLELFDTGTLGGFQFTFGDSTQPMISLSDQDIGDITTEFGDFPSAPGILAQSNGHYTPEKEPPLSTPGSHWPSLIMPAKAETQSNSSMPRRDFPLGIITALHNQQKSISWASISETLLIAREGLDSVSQHIFDLPPLTQPASISSTLLIASFLILQQAIACYTELGTQATARFERSKNGQSDGGETLLVGGFRIEGSESCKSVLDVLIRAEVSRGRSILARLQQVANELRKVGDDKTGLFEIAFSRGFSG